MRGAIIKRLEELGVAGSVGKYLSEADIAALQTFLAEASVMDRAYLAAHRAALRGGGGVRADLEPVEGLRVKEDDEAVGMASMAAGEWASVVFAGGAATRFYSEARDDMRVRAAVERFGGVPPKGLVPVTPVAGFSFVELFVHEALAAGVSARRLPVVVFLTSSLTDRAISRFIQEADFQGFPKTYLLTLRQAEHPRLDLDGDVVVDRDGHMVKTGDGHGGVFRALLRADSGPSMADRLRTMGIRSLVLHNVDNALARPFDWSRLGFHRRGRFLLTMTVVERARPEEKVGLVVRDRTTGQIEVVEYSVCPKEVALAQDKTGQALFRLAHINTNLVELDAVNPAIPPTLYTGKMVEVSGRLVPTSSFEMLNQHLSSLLPPNRVGVLLVERGAYFLPTKTVRGEDSLLHTVATLSAIGRMRLLRGGASVAGDATIEVSPCVPEDLCWPGLSVGHEAWLYIGVRHGPFGLAPIGRGVRVEDGARLKVIVERPYGLVQVGPDRSCAEDPTTAGRVRVGDGVVVEGGADICISVEGDGVLFIRDNARLSGSQDIRVPGGTHLTIPDDSA